LNAHRPVAKAFAVLVILVVVAGLLSYSLIQFRVPLKPVVRHVNPAAEAEQPPLPTFLALMVTNVFDSLIGGDYKAAAEGLKTLGAAYIPERYRFIAERFMQLLNEASSLLNDTGGLLDRAEALITLGGGEDAKPLLNEASGKLASANATCIELRSACEELARTFSLPTGELRRRVDDLGRVIEELYGRLLRLLETIEKQTTLEDSYLTVDVEPKTVWTGGSIEVSGRLYTAKVPLNGRSVQIYVDGAELAEAVTGGEGEFHAKVSLPYIYKPKIPIQARYMTKGLDSEAYKPSASNIVEVSLLYVKPAIKAETVGEALPGKTFILKGSVEAERPLPYSAVKVSWAGASLTASLEDGRFKATLYTPEGISDGEHSLKVEAQAWQTFAPAEATVRVKVQRLPLNVTLQPPIVIFAGFPSNLNGKIVYSHEGFNVTVRAIFAGQAYTAHSSGEFSVGLAVPSTFFSGYQDYEVYVSPDLPWYRSAALRGSILVVNPLTVLFPFGLVSALALKLSRGRRIEGAEPEEVFQGQEAQRQAPVKAYSAASGLEWLIDMYWQAVVIVSRLTGVYMKPFMTMREYLDAVRHGLGGLRAGFEALTVAAEKALYSPAVSAEEVESARKALEELKVAHVEVQP
jgi:hypothetical protein